MEVSGSGVNSTMDLSLDMVSSLFPNGGVGTMGGKVMSRSCCAHTGKLYGIVHISYPVPENNTYLGLAFQRTLKHSVAKGMLTEVNGRKVVNRRLVMLYPQVGQH